MKEILRLCVVLTVIGAVCAAVMAFVDGKTKGPIEKNRAGEKMDAVKVVMPPSDNDIEKDAVTLDDGGTDFIVYRGTKDGVATGAAFVVIAPDGYSGDIEILVGVDTAGVVTGVKVLKHLETPGLGAKIETPEFNGQFVGKSVANPPSWEVTKDGGTFVPITGATISSRAVTHAIARGLGLVAAHTAEVFGGAPAAPAEGSAAEKAGGR